MSGPACVEQLLPFLCEGDRLWAVLSRPADAGAEASTGVVIVVGGPQYRVGSHRQFVLLARGLAQAGFPTLRFDYRGMGDSEGETRTFEDIEVDLRAAIDSLCTACPRVRRVVVWGLCDGASAAMMFATADDRVAGLVLVNPWARSESSLALAHVKYYYGARLLQREFWAKLLHGGLDWRASLSALLANLRGARLHSGRDRPDSGDGSFHTAMARGLARFRGAVLLVLSGNDLTAREFLQYAAVDNRWKGLLDTARVSRVEIAQADHTFSRRVWLDRLEAETVDWLAKLRP